MVCASKKSICKILIHFGFASESLTLALTISDFITNSEWTWACTIGFPMENSDKMPMTVENSRLNFVLRRVALCEFYRFMTETPSCSILIVIIGAGVVCKLLLLSNCHQLSALARPAHDALNSNLFTRINDEHDSDSTTHRLCL